MSAYPLYSLTTTLDKMKLLLWRLDLSKQTFTNLNTCPDIVLSSENYRFFKDRDYQKQMLHVDDLATMEQAINHFKERRRVQIVFRVQLDNRTRWYKMVGWPSDDFRYYEGAVEEISDQIPDLKDIFERQNQVLLEHAGVPYPVALFVWPYCTLQKANLSFVELLGLKPTEKRKVHLKDLLIGDINLPSLLENLISDRQIATELQLTAGERPAIKANCRLEYFSHNGQGYLRLSVLEPSVNNLLARQKPPTNHDGIKELCKRLTACASSEEMLENIYQSRELFSGLDTVMYSDIYARKNKVIVYAKGKMKESLRPGSQFAYAGTIAENIKKENLEYLIVEDTQSSIKAIDWMLFVPKGIYSYIAKACYERGAMRTVLIFCSQQKNTFSEHQVEAVSMIASVFHKQLKKIRRMEKSTF